MLVGRFRPAVLCCPTTPNRVGGNSCPRTPERSRSTPAWLDYKQAEAYSNLSRTTLWALINAQEIKAAHVGRAVRIERASLQDLMERSSEEAIAR
jgi:excisionase family DNA binding protein